MFKILRVNSNRLGQRTEVYLQSAGPASYSQASKIAFNPATDTGETPIRNVDRVDIDVEGNYTAQYDFTNHRVTVYDLAGTEVADAADLSAVVFHIRVLGNP